MFFFQHDYGIGKLDVLKACDSCASSFRFFSVPRQYSSVMKSLEVAAERKTIN